MFDIIVFALIYLYSKTTNLNVANLALIIGIVLTLATSFAVMFSFYNFAELTSSIVFSTLLILLVENFLAKTK